MSRVALLSLLLLPLACDKAPESPKAPAKSADDKADASKDGADKSAADKDASKPDAKPVADAAHGGDPAGGDQAIVGKPAPAFSLTDIDGKAHALADYKGKVVVLEWFNPECPFVKFAHTEGPLATMAKDEVAKGIVWLSINSGGVGKQGHGVEANRKGIATYGMENPVLLDENGAVGHLYGAEKTPHIYVVDEQGVLVYRGAIDNAPFGETQGEDKVNHVAVALEQLRSGNPIANAQTAPYGCTVKYSKS